MKCKIRYVPYSKRQILLFFRLTMADFFRSAFDYLNSVSINTSQDNDFVGQYVELGTQKLRVKSVIAEGKIYYSKSINRLK